jgi:3-hydroxybutyryl-CoA dehydrogenase
MSGLQVIAAWGAGRMGRGIAQTFAFSGHQVLLLDSKSREPAASEQLRDQAMQEITQSLAGLQTLGFTTPEQIAATLARIHYVSFEGAPTAIQKADIVFEGVPETLDAKRDAFMTLSKIVRPDCIVASTTSTMLSTELSQWVSLPERFLNAHWLNPAHLIPLVEVSPHAGTAVEVTNALLALLRAIGKKPVVCKPVPGFIVPRLQSLVMNEAARMIEQGVATAEDIDIAIRYGFGPRYAAMGVLEFVDVGGLDILYYASQYLAASLQDERYAAPDIVRNYMLQGRQGLKTGQGFFDYQNQDIASYRQALLARQVALLEHLKLMPQFDIAVKRNDGV